MKYNVTLVLANGDEVRAALNAATADRAVNILTKLLSRSPGVRKRDIVRIGVTPIAGEDADPKAGRYIVQASQDEGRAVVTDTECGVVVTFEVGNFNDSARTTLLNDYEGDDVMRVATALRELGGWLATNRPDLITADADKVAAWRLLKVCRQVAEARKAKGLTFRDLGRACGISPGNLCRYEAGSLVPKVDTLSRIAGALGITIEID